MPAPATIGDGNPGPSEAGRYRLSPALLIRQLYHSEPPRISRDLLIREIGYRLQEIEHGGLGKSIRRAHWSGPRFFGLLAAGAAPPSEERCDG